MHGNDISSVEKNDAKRWLIIGAHQAGANHKKIARMCGLSQPSVRRIILNFQKTGSPSIPTKMSQKAKSKPVVEYDEEGNLIDSEDELPPVTLKEKIKARRPSAKDLIAYVLNKAQHAEESALFVQPDNWRPPTPPRDSLLPYNNDRQQREAIHSPPLTDSSSSSPTQQNYETIRGFESWTVEDDKILMAHVLTRLSGCRWQEAALKLRGKHSATTCEKRWQVLRDLLIRGADKSGTRGW
ncbi:hypothetical protein INT47_009764 [Mucor saturninus]|uniref:Myb-like domain-containing protein n=1 Tax=Mucor saturninus TaxID=64648 RepID=A0A8H7UYS2_9FUNG|nr:hypothetical protein INT47_009764 [Mucor saturninus]